MNPQNARLFTDGPNWPLNACVGKNGGIKDYSHYARGFFEAGDRLIQSLHEDRQHVDYLIYPLVLK